MAKFEARCPFCKMEFQAEEEWVGQTGECPVCNKVFIIRKAFSALVQEERQSIVPPPPPPCSYNEKDCPFCGERIKTSAIKCKYCQTVLNDGMKNRDNFNIDWLGFLKFFPLWLIGLSSAEENKKQKEQVKELFLKRRKTALGITAVLILILSVPIYIYVISPVLSPISILRVMKANSEAGRNTSSPSEIARNISSISLIGCPGDFREAFNSYVRASQRLAAEIKDQGGNTYALSVRYAYDQVNSAFEDVTRIADKHCAIPKK